MKREEEELRLYEDMTTKGRFNGGGDDDMRFDEFKNFRVIRGGLTTDASWLQHVSFVSFFSHDDVCSAENLVCILLL